MECQLELDEKDVRQIIAKAMGVDSKNVQITTFMNTVGYYEKEEPSFKVIITGVDVKTIMMSKEYMGG